MRKNSYRSTALKNVNVSAILASCAEGALSIGLDIAKNEILAVLRDSSGRFERPWKIKQPTELRLLVSMLRELRDHHELLVSMESTGTYGDALRQALTDAGLQPRRVSGKAVSDYAEIFDGVPSAHDGKDAAIVAELAAIGKSRPWPTRVASDQDGAIRRQVDGMDMQQRILRMWQGRLEALVARHWPELTRLLKLNSVTLLRILAFYGSPSALASDSQACQRLAGWGRGYLKLEKIQRIQESAVQTVGVRLTTEETRTIQCCAEQALTARQAVRAAHHELERLADEHATVKRIARVVGKATACVLFVSVGDPRAFHCGEAYRKAMGLNLKERSSGLDQGKLRITKRGPSMARRWLFFAALRECKKSPVKGWFEAKKRKDRDRGLGAVVGIMRKIALAIYAVVKHDQPYSPSRLFPGCQVARLRRRIEMNTNRASESVARLDLSHEGKDQMFHDGKEVAESQPRPPHSPVSAPGSALGSVPTGALSSDQDQQT